MILSPQAMDQKTTAKEGLEKTLKKVQADITDTDDWGEKSLAYPIEGNDKGYYVVYQVAMKGEAHARLNQLMGLEKGLMRWLLVKLPS